MRSVTKAISRPPAGGYNHVRGNIPSLPSQWEFTNMFCTYRTLLVVIALNVSLIGGAEEPAAARSSGNADTWSTLEWKKATPFSLCASGVPGRRR